MIGLTGCRSVRPCAAARFLKTMAPPGLPSATVALSRSSDVATAHPPIASGIDHPGGRQRGLEKTTTRHPSERLCFLEFQIPAFLPRMAQEVGLPRGLSCCRMCLRHMSKLVPL
jgi:hypothetical protein